MLEWIHVVLSIKGAVQLADFNVKGKLAHNFDGDHFFQKLKLYSLWYRQIIAKERISKTYL